MRPHPTIPLQSSAANNRERKSASPFRSSLSAIRFSDESRMHGPDFLPDRCRECRSAIDQIKQPCQVSPGEPLSTRQNPSATPQPPRLSNANAIGSASSHSSALSNFSSVSAPCRSPVLTFRTAATPAGEGLFATEFTGFPEIRQGALMITLGLLRRCAIGVHRSIIRLQFEPPYRNPPARPPDHPWPAS